MHHPSPNQFNMLAHRGGASLFSCLWEIPQLLCSRAQDVTVGSSQQFILPTHPDASSSSSQMLTQRWATKKAGGAANQQGNGNAKNLGIKTWDSELIFPGTIILRQRGTKTHPGYNVGMGRDHTIFATSVGFVKFTKEQTAVGPGTKERKFVSVVPITGDDGWGPEYKELEKTMIERRAFIKRQILRRQAFEPALFFPMRSAGEKQFSWIGQKDSGSVVNSAGIGSDTITSSSSSLKGTSAPGSKKAVSGDAEVLGGKRSKTSKGAPAMQG